MKTLTPLLGNKQRLDGGAMFGNAPKAMWEKWTPADEHNRIDLACRCMLVNDNGRLILFEAGVGAFFEPRLKERFGVVESEHMLLQQLQAKGIDPQDIDTVVLSHLHFDHAGGILHAYEPNAPLRLAFNKAKIVTTQQAFERAKHPHPRDKASFISGFCDLLENSGQLVLIQNSFEGVLPSGYRAHLSHGHTPGMLISEVQFDNKTGILFMADLIPGKAWVHVPITMGYDRFPEAVIDEKRFILEYAFNEQLALFYTHDPETAFTSVQKDGFGRFFAGPVPALPLF